MAYGKGYEITKIHIQKKKNGHNKKKEIKNMSKVICIFIHISVFAHLLGRFQFALPPFKVM